jgi:hypothetical protein
MSSLNHRARYKRKQRWVRRIIEDTSLTNEERDALLWLSGQIDENGRVINPKTQRAIDQSAGEERSGDPERH